MVVDISVTRNFSDDFIGNTTCLGAVAVGCPHTTAFCNFKHGSIEMFHQSLPTMQKKKLVTNLVTSNL